MFKSRIAYGAVETQGQIVAVALRKRNGNLHVQHAALADKDNKESLTALRKRIKRNHVWVGISTEASNGTLLLRPVRGEDGTFASVGEFTREQQNNAINTQVLDDIHYTHARLAACRIITSPLTDKPPAHFLLGAAISEEIVTSTLTHWRELGFGLVNLSPQAISLPNLFLATADGDVQEHILLADSDDHGCDFVLLSQGRLLHHHRSPVTMASGARFTTELERRCERLRYSELAGEMPQIILLPHETPIELEHYTHQQWDPFQSGRITFGSHVIETCCKTNARLAAAAIGTALQGF